MMDDLAFKRCENVAIEKVTSSSDTPSEPPNILPSCNFLTTSESPIATPDIPQTDHEVELEPLKSTVVDKQFIDTLKSAADSITPALNREFSASLEEDITSWCDLHGVTDTTSVETRTFLARQTVLNFLLKATLHAWYNEHEDSSTPPSAPKKVVKQITEQLKNPAVTDYLLDDLLQFADEEALNVVMEERHRLSQSAHPAEDIGRLYESLTSNADRRTIGYFRTPPEIGRFMRNWAVSDGDNVLDIGVGAGVLSRPFHPLWEIDNREISITGVDRSQLAVLMGTTALTLYRQTHECLKRDFLDIQPADVPIAVDSIISNPPYTRHMDLSSAYRDKIKAQTQKEVGSDVPGKLPLFGHIICHARRFLSPGDRAAFIIPRHVLTTGYGAWLKRFLLDEFVIRAFVWFDDDDGCVFDEALSTGMVVLLEAAEEEEPEGMTRFIRVDEEPDTASLRAAIRDGQQGSTNWGVINSIEQSTLAPDHNWQSLFDPVTVDTSHLTPLSEIADVSRGLSTGENDFFCLSQSEVNDWELNEKHLSRLLRRPGIMEGYSFDERDWERQRGEGNDVWLLYHFDDVDGVPDTIKEVEKSVTDWSNTSSKEGNSSVGAYLRYGLQDHGTVSERTVVQNRSPWYGVERRDPAPVLIPNMTRDGFCAILNETEARHLNNIHGVYPDSSIDDRELKALLAYLNSGFVEKVVHQHKRTYAGGLDKIEPGDLKDIPVIDPRELSSDVVTALAELFDELREASSENKNGNPVIEHIDTILEAEL